MTQIECEDWTEPAVMLDGSGNVMYTTTTFDPYIDDFGEWVYKTESTARRWDISMAEYNSGKRTTVELPISEIPNFKAKQYARLPNLKGCAGNSQAATIVNKVSSINPVRLVIKNEKTADIIAFLLIAFGIYYYYNLKNKK